MSFVLQPWQLLCDARHDLALASPTRRSEVGLQPSPQEGREASGVTNGHACRWLEAGGSLVALQELLGHASITTTQRYARLTDAAVQLEAARVMGNGVGNIGLCTA